MAKTKQVTLYLDEDLFNDITGLAEDEKRSFTNMAELLLMIGRNNWKPVKSKKAKEKVK